LIKFCNSLFQGIIRVAKCHIALGEITLAEKAIGDAEKKEPGKQLIITAKEQLEALKQYLDYANKSEALGDFTQVNTHTPKFKAFSWFLVYVIFDVNKNFSLRSG
jgi:hypothetical protein